MVSAPGTIDSDYRGELKVLLVNLGSGPATIARGERIAQLVIAPVTRAVFVESTEASKVVFSIFDLAIDPPVEYRDSMIQHVFERVFGYPSDTGQKWTWHDKTPFPWEKIIDHLPDGPRPASASQQMSTARRVTPRGLPAEVESLI